MQLRSTLAGLAMLASGCSLPAFGGPDARSLPPMSEAEAVETFEQLHALRSDAQAHAAMCGEVQWGGCEHTALTEELAAEVRCSYVLPRSPEGPEGDLRVLVVETHGVDRDPVLGQWVAEPLDGSVPSMMNARYETGAMLTRWDSERGDTYGTRDTFHRHTELSPELAEETERLQAVLARSCEEPQLYTDLLLSGDVEDGFVPDVPREVYEVVLRSRDALRQWAEGGPVPDASVFRPAPDLHIGFRDDLLPAGDRSLGDRDTWVVDVPASRPIRGGERIDVLQLLADEENEQLDLELTEDRTCVEPLGEVEGLTRDDGVVRVSVQPRQVTWCGQWFAIDLYVERDAPHRLVAVGLDVGDALEPTSGDADG